MKMRMELYPNIRQDESVAIEFIINGLNTRPKFRHKPDIWIESNTVPTDITNLVQRLKAL